MAHEKNLFCLVLFLPTGLLLWHFPPPVLALFCGFSMGFFLVHTGIRAFGRFLKTWGLFALFWAAFSFASSLAFSDTSLESSAMGAGVLFTQLITLFLWMATLVKETTPAGLADALAVLLRPVLKTKAADVRTAFLLTAASFARKKDVFKKVSCGVDLRFHDKSRLFRLKTLLVGLLQTLERDATGHAEGFCLRRLDNSSRLNALPSPTHRVYVVLFAVLLSELAAVYAMTFF